MGAGKSKDPAASADQAPQSGDVTIETLNWKIDAFHASGGVTLALVSIAIPVGCAAFCYLRARLRELLSQQTVLPTLSSSTRRVMEQVPEWLTFGEAPPAYRWPQMPSSSSCRQEFVREAPVRFSDLLNAAEMAQMAPQVPQRHRIVLLEEPSGESPLAEAALEDLPPEDVAMPAKAAAALPAAPNVTPEENFATTRTALNSSNAPEVPAMASAAASAVTKPVEAATAQPTALVPVSQNAGTRPKINAATLAQIRDALGASNVGFSASLGPAAFRPANNVGFNGRRTLPAELELPGFPAKSLVLHQRI